MTQQPKKPSFQRSPVPAPPRPAAPSQPLLPELASLDGMPVRKVATAALTPYTRSQLDQLGWQEGDAIPGDLAQRLKRAQEELEAASPATHGFAPGSRTKIGKQLDISELPEEKQAELRAAISQAKLQGEQEEAQASQRAGRERRLANASPSVRQALQAGEEAARAGLQASTAQRSEPDDDAMPELVLRHGAKRPPAQPPRTTLPEPAPSPAEPAAAEPLPEATAGAGGAVPPRRCPRCLHDLTEPFGDAYTEEEKDQFVAALLSVGAQRFVKEESLLNGRLFVAFRSLSSAEVNLAHKQLGYEARRGELQGELAFMLRLTQLRLVMSAFRLTDARGAILAEIPPVLEMECEEAEGQTRLVPLLEWFDTEFCPEESLRRVIAALHRKFQRTVEALEARAASPDF